VRLGAGRSAPSEPEPAQPAPNHRQPEEAAGGLGEDGEQQQQAWNAQNQGRHRPFEQDIETNDVDVDKAVDWTEPAEADGEPAFITGRDAATWSWAGTGT
jgi:hypothetical protein